MNDRNTPNSSQRETRRKRKSSQNDESKDKDGNADSIALRRSKRISKKVRDSELSPFVYEHYSFKPSFFPRIKKSFFQSVQSQSKGNDSRNANKNKLLNIKEEQKDPKPEVKNKEISKPVEQTKSNETPQTSLSDESEEEDDVSHNIGIGKPIMWAGEQVKKKDIVEIYEKLYGIKYGSHTKINNKKVNALSKALSKHQDIESNKESSKGINKDSTKNVNKEIKDTPAVIIQNENPQVIQNPNKSVFDNVRRERRSKYNFDRMPNSTVNNQLAPLNFLVKKTREDYEENELEKQQRSNLSNNQSLGQLHHMRNSEENNPNSNKILFIDTERRQFEKLAEAEQTIPNPLCQQIEHDKEAVSLTVNLDNGDQKLYTQVNKPTGPCMLNEFLALYDKIDENEHKNTIRTREYNNENVSTKQLDFNVFSNAIIRSELLCFFPENMINPAFNPTEESSATSQLMQNGNIERLNLLKIPVSKQLLELLD